MGVVVPGCSAGRRMLVALLGFVGLFLVGFPALALPPDRIVYLEPDTPRIVTIPAGSWEAVSLAPDLVRAEVYSENEEMSLEPLMEGVGLVLLANHALGQVQFIEARIGGQAPPASLPEPSAFPKASACRLEGKRLRCEVKSPASLEALSLALAAQAVPADQLMLVFELEVLQAQLKKMEQELARAGHPGIQLAYVGANLRIKGRVPDRAAWRQVIVILYKHHLGRLVLEDRLQIDPSKTP